MKKQIAAGVLSVLSACSTMKNRDMHDRLVQNIEKKDYPAALAIVKSPDFYGEERSLLLKQMETGTAFYDAGMYFNALKEFDAAQKLSDALYTKSVSAAVKGALDSNQAEFYGARYERSQIRFYQSLIHYNLYDVGKYEGYGEVPEKILSESERKFHLAAAKNTMREWHSIFAQYKAETEGKPEYKADLMEHLWGAFMHESSGVSADRQVALGLYKEAKNVLFQNYNIYPIFNKKSDTFVKDFAKLGEMDKSVVEKDYIDATEYGKSLAKFIDDKIAKLEKGSPDNVVLVLKQGLVAEKKAKEYKLEFNSHDMLSLSYLSAYITAASGGSGKNVSNAMFVSFATTYLLNGITYDLPYIEEKSPLQVSATLKGSGKSVDMSFALVSPISSIAYKEINDKIPGEKAVLIARLTGEYIAAAATAYFSYAAVKGKKTDGMSELMAIVAATSTFKGLGAGIEAHNKADIRQWKLLPNNIYLGGANVPKGKYTLEIRAVESNQLLATKPVEVDSKTTFIDMNL